MSSPTFARVRLVLAVLLLLTGGGVLAVYLAGRREAARHPLPKIPPLGLKISRTENGITVSRDEGNRPVFRLYADRAEQLKDGGREELFNVRIDVYDADGLHADQITGKRLSFNQATDEITATDTVEIAVDGRPAPAVTQGTATATAVEQEAPIRIEAHDLVFNVRTGLGTVAHGVTFTYREAHGGAGSAAFAGHTREVDLGNGVSLQWPRPGQPEVDVHSGYAQLNRALGRIELRQAAKVTAGTQALTSDHILVTLNFDDSLRRVEAWEGVHASDTAPARRFDTRAQHAAADFRSPGVPNHVVLNHAARSMIDHLRLDGGVTLTGSSGQQAASTLTAGATDFYFDAGNALRLVEARNQARVTLPAPHRADLAAPGLDFHFAQVTSAKSMQLADVDSQGRAQMDMTTSLAAGPARPVHAEADTFHLDLNAAQQPTQATASGSVLLREPNPEGGERLSTSDALTLNFSPTRSASDSAAISQAVQTGRVTVTEAERRLTADRLVYTAADRRIVLTAQAGSGFTHGQVESVDPSLWFRAPNAVIVDAGPGIPERTVDASGGVSVSLTSTAALEEGTSPFLGSAKPTVVTSATMHSTQPTAKGSASDHATFSGHVRLFQAPYLLEADRVDLDRPRMRLEAHGQVLTHLVQPASSGVAAVPMATKSRTPEAVTVAADDFAYSNSTMRAQYTGHVKLDSSDVTVTSDGLTAQLAASDVPGAKATTPASMESAVALGNVHLSQPGRTRQGTADRLDYTAATQNVVLTGGPPRIFDAEQGDVTGDVLTFYLTNDAITIESNSGKRTVVQRIVH